MTNALHRPAWVPVAGHQLHVAGVHFDAVRIDGIHGELVADWLVEATDEDAGPIVCEAGGGRWVYFLLAPGEISAYDWPRGVQQLGGGRRTRTVTYVGIPALEGNTWPLRWYSGPTATAPYVSAARLLAALGTGR
ncbi:hypothetical protein [Streptomyces sp. AC627_RSS907]|uniref:hypothetical protein n=1 Tax=Streptomyces sp. AC627_RSS907 TaxID=2823684 RepID=UPI0020B7F4ED|nr:hypothetical protein [Streptomyces sp. AC627_RSS907]